ncbi:MAG TPA: hypothetical protein VMG10_05040 [Gemmataceae bacterium]|nr:hypothetical protein [Gemmataceae bacterium]
MRPVDFKQVKLLVNMRQVLSLIGWEPRHNRWNTLRGDCPLCKRRSEDGRIFEVTGSGFHCWKCQAKGSHLDLYARFVGKPLLEAAIEMCGKAGVSVPYLPLPAAQPDTPRTEKRHQ